MSRRAGTGSPHQAHRSRHPYRFNNLVFCCLCRRKMQGQHSHGTAYYRCRYALANSIEHPRSVTLREDVLIDPLDTWLAQEFSPQRRQQTVAKLIEHANLAVPPVVAPAGPTINECDTKLARYRAAADAGADPAVVARWIADVEDDRRAAEQSQRRRLVGL